MAWKELTRDDVVANVRAEINNDTDLDKGIIDCTIDHEAGVVRLRARVNSRIYTGEGETKEDAINDIVVQVMSGMRK